MRDSAISDKVYVMRVAMLWKVIEQRISGIGGISGICTTYTTFYRMSIKN